MTATTESDIFSAPVDGTHSNQNYRRDVVLDITFIHCVYLTNFHFSRNKRKLLFFTEGISLLGALLKQELDRNRGLLFWGSGQDRAGGLRACRRD